MIMSKLKYFYKSYILFLFFSISYGQKYDEFSTKQLTGQSDIHITKNENFQLLPEVAESFKLMKKAALNNGINIKIVSSFRSFTRQKQIWNNKFIKNDSIGYSVKKNIKKIMEYSTIPGTSRHHWGTDIDIIDGNISPKGDVLLTEKFYGNGPYVKLEKWLGENSEKFGFYLVYTNDNERNGFKHEPWHYSYAPLSKEFLVKFIEIDLKKMLNENKILGSEYMSDKFLASYIKNFILGINPKLKSSFNE